MIYVDEAGTSDPEPVRVVAAIIVEADSQWQVLANDLTRIVKEHVPSQWQEEFIVHGKELFNGGRLIDRNVWPFEERLDFMKEVLCLPFVHDVPIAFGIAHKGCFTEADIKLAEMDSNLFEHCSAFIDCVERSDAFLRKYLRGSEVGTIVAEDIPQRKSILSKYALLYKGNPISISSENLQKTKIEKQLGLEPEPVTFDMKHIIDSAHFIAKTGAPLLQIADLCAFTLRRCLSKQPHGNDLLNAMLGAEQASSIINDEIWFSGHHSALYNTSSYWTEDQKLDHWNKQLFTYMLHIAGNSPNEPVP